MIDYRDRTTIKALAAKCQMPESFVRQMLAIESGENIDDVIEVAPRTRSIPWVALGVIFLCVAAFAVAAIR